ncbi:MAG: hypothetical protein ACLUEQ_05065 [Cloacibacillus evryensis]
MRKGSYTRERMINCASLRALLQGMSAAHRRQPQRAISRPRARNAASSTPAAPDMTIADCFGIENSPGAL